MSIRPDGSRLRDAKLRGGLDEPLCWLIDFIRDSPTRRWRLAHLSLPRPTGLRERIYLGDYTTVRSSRSSPASVALRCRSDLFRFVSGRQEVHVDLILQVLHLSASTQVARREVARRP